MEPLWAFEIKLRARRNLWKIRCISVGKGIFQSTKSRARSKAMIKSCTAVFLWLEVSGSAGVPEKLNIICYFSLNIGECWGLAIKEWADAVIRNGRSESLLLLLMLSCHCLRWSCCFIVLKRMEGSAWHCRSMFEFTSPLFILLTPLCLCLYTSAEWL